MEDKYQFEWCKNCACLRGCYYQHGEYSDHPHFLEPCCGEGPMKPSMGITITEVDGHLIEIQDVEDFDDTSDEYSSDDEQAF